MSSLEDIPGLEPELLSSLEMAGIETAADLVAVPARVVRHAIEGAMPEAKKVPTIEQVEEWQRLVRDGLRPVKAVDPPPPGQRLAGSDFSFSQIDPLPVAESLSSRQLMDSGIPASAVPVAKVLGDPTPLNLSGVRRGAEAPSEVAAARSLPANKTAEATRWGAETPKPLPEVRRMVEPEKEEEQEEAPVPTSFTSTEERSRIETDFERKNRGMTHKDPMRVLRGAFATLLALLLVFAGVGTAVAALTMEFWLKKPVPVELAFGLLAFPLALVTFLVFANSARCRLCGQRLFMPRNCHKHERAHRSVFGYAVALAAHVVVFRWFRCSLCGTKQKLK